MISKDRSCSERIIDHSLRSVSMHTFTHLTLPSQGTETLLMMFHSFRLDQRH